LKVIPVLDIKNGLVVLAKMGLRDAYKPVRSWLCPFSSPVAMVEVLKSLGFKEVYVADLDAITYGTPDLALYRALASRIKVMVDPGLRSLEDASRILEVGVHKLILATETLSCLTLAEKVLETFGPGRAILSLDLRNRKVLSKAAELRDLDPLTCLRKMVKLGFKEVIAIDLARVGSFAGPDLELVKILKKVPVKLITGGGVRSLKDLKLLEQEGVEAVLVASALHRSTLSVDELSRMGFL